MGRRSSSQPLAIWTNGELVGHWTPATRRPMELRYEDGWLASSAARPLSLSLPLPLVGNEPLRGDRVEYFFDNLLRHAGQWILRLAQEDFCQALGVSPTRKYEADGGPGVEQMAQVLSGSRNARADLRTLLASQIVFWLLAATDGHAKNFSIRLQAGGAYALTPLYDVLSAWPIIGHSKTQLAWRNAKLAMAVSGKNRHYELATILRRHFNATAARCGWGANAEDILTGLLDRLEPAIASVTSQMPGDFPQDVAETIFEGVRGQAQRLQEQPAS